MPVRKRLRLHARSAEGYQILDFMGKATLDIFRQLDNWGMDFKGAIKMLKNKFKELQKLPVQFTGQIPRRVCFQEIDHTEQK